MEVLHDDTMRFRRPGYEVSGGCLYDAPSASAANDNAFARHRRRHRPILRRGAGRRRGVGLPRPRSGSSERTPLAGDAFFAACTSSTHVGTGRCARGTTPFSSARGARTRDRHHRSDQRRGRHRHRRSTLRAAQSHPPPSRHHVRAVYASASRSAGSWSARCLRPTTPTKSSRRRGRASRGRAGVPGRRRARAWGFLYYAFVIGMTPRVHVSVVSTRMRRLTLATEGPRLLQHGHPRDRRERRHRTVGR